MKLVKLPDGQWVRADHVVMLDPIRILTTGEKGEEIITSKLRVVVETNRAGQEFYFGWPKAEDAFTVADQLAKEIMADDYNHGLRVQYTGQPIPIMGAGFIH